MDIETESMMETNDDDDNGDDHKPSTIESLHIFKSQIESLETQSVELTKEIDVKNQRINELDQNNFDLSQANDVLKCDVTNLTELNVNYQNEIQQLRQLLQMQQNEDNGATTMTTTTLNDENQRSTLQHKCKSLIDELHSKTIELQKTRKDSLIDNIENLAKLNQNTNHLSVLQEKNEYSRKFIQSKDEYIGLLLGYIENLQVNFNRLEQSFRDEINEQAKRIFSKQNENQELSTQNRLLKENLITTQTEVTKLVENLETLKTVYNQLKQDRDNCQSKAIEEKEGYVEEIEKLNNLLKQSKNEIVDQYIEKLYPSITSLCQMLGANVSVSQLYSSFLEKKRNNEDLKIEKTVLTERVAILDSELESSRTAVQKLTDEVQTLRNLEGKIFQLENDKKELTVALKFYQDSAQSLYKGSKSFNENFIALSGKIQQLAQQSSNEISSENSSGLMALKYIMELQNKFQDFNKLQTEFEKGKLDLVNEKRSLIETDNELESLRNQVSLLDSEKRVYTSKYELLNREYEMLQNLMHNLKSNYEMESTRLNTANQTLQTRVISLSSQIENLKSDSIAATERHSKLEQDNSSLQNQLQCQTQETEFANQRHKTQQTFLTQMEKSLTHLRKQNTSLVEINRKLTDNLNLVQTKHSEANQSVINLESLLAEFKLRVSILTQKESLLNRKLDDNQKNVMLKQELTTLFDSLKHTSTSIESDFIKKIQSLENEKFNLVALNEQKETYWREEKSQLEIRNAELLASLDVEKKNYDILMTNYLELQKINLPTVIEENAEPDQVLRSENEVLRQQLENVRTQFQELTDQANISKQKLTELTQENSTLLTLQNELRIQISLSRNEKENIATQLDQLTSQLSAKSIELETKLNSSTEKYAALIEQNQTELANKENACHSYLTKIENLNQTIADLSCRLEHAEIAAESAQKQIAMHAEQNSLLQLKFEQELARYTEIGDTISELRKRNEQLQSRINEAEIVRVKADQEYADNYNRALSDVAELRADRVRLNELLVNVNQLNQKLVGQVEELRQQMANDASFASKREQLIELETLTRIIENLSAENKLLHEKYDLFAKKEARLNSEIESLQAKQQQENRLQQQSESMTNLSSFYSALNNNEQMQSISESHQKLRAEKDQLERQCLMQSHQIALLEQRLQSEDVANLHKTISSDKTQIETLNIQLTAKVHEAEQLTQRLKSQDEQNQKLTQDIRELNLKITNQAANLELLKKELNGKETFTQKNQSEVNNLKSSLAMSEESQKSLRKDIEQLRKEATTLQNTNQQLKMLARKYKSQCDELQKSANSQAVANEKTTKEESAKEAAANVEKDDKIKNLEELIKTNVTECEKAKADFAKLSKENEELISQMNLLDLKAKKIAQQAWQKLSDSKQMIASKNAEISSLKNLLLSRGQSSNNSRSTTSTTSSSSISSNNNNNNNNNLPSTSKAISYKMPVSSNYISASLPSTSFDSSISSNLQPSSSNQEDAVTLQSAQITSHDDNDDDDNNGLFSGVESGSQVADNNVTSNKRGYSSDGVDDSQKKARHEEQEDNLYEEDEDDDDDNNNEVNDDDDDDDNDDDDDDDDDVVEMIENIEEDSNDVSATGQPEGSAEGSMRQMEENNENENSAGPSNSEAYEQLDSASSSHQLVSRPNSIDFLVPPTSSSSMLDPMLIEPGPSSRQHFATSSGSTFHSVPLSLRSNITASSVSDMHRSINHHQRMAPTHGAPRLIIPGNNLHSPPNPMMNQLGSYHEEGEGVVPSTPILYAPRFDESMISPQVPQSRFMFGAGGGASGNGSGSLGHLGGGGGGAGGVAGAISSGSSSSTTPSISTIMLDDAIVQFESNSAQQDDQVPSLPTSSDSSTLAANAPNSDSNSSQEHQPSMDRSGRPRRLRIQRSARGRQ